MGIDALITEKKINAAVYIFNMKNRFGWVDRKDLKAQDPIEISISCEYERRKWDRFREIEEMPDSERRTKLNQLLEARQKIKGPPTF